MTNTKRKIIRKEGEGGGFGDSGGTAFTSTDAGIFTPTYGDQPKKKKKRTGIHRLADFLTDNSPERKMEKTMTGTKSIGELIKWVTIELRKQNEVKSKHQINPQITKGDREVEPDPNNKIINLDEQLVQSEESTGEAYYKNIIKELRKPIRKIDVV
tara:strand:+ start:181 stop:648 length:468 start_codon:yes stop_codon:yes gene_type:complete